MREWILNRIPTANILLSVRLHLIHSHQVMADNRQRGRTERMKEWYSVSTTTENRNNNEWTLQSKQWRQKWGNRVRSREYIYAEWYWHTFISDDTDGLPATDTDISSECNITMSSVFLNTISEYIFHSRLFNKYLLYYAIELSLTFSFSLLIAFSFLNSIAHITIYYWIDISH